MTEQVNIYEAKTQLSSLVERAAAGEEIVIARSGKPVARLMPLERASFRRTPGVLRGQLRIAEDFDELPAELAAAFDGE